MRCVWQTHTVIRRWINSLTLLYPYFSTHLRTKSVSHLFILLQLQSSWFMITWKRIELLLAMTLELGAADCQAFFLPHSQLIRACRHLEWVSKQVDRHRCCLAPSKELNQVLKILTSHLWCQLFVTSISKIYLFCWKNADHEHAYATSGGLKRNYALHL